MADLERKRARYDLATSDTYLAMRTELQNITVERALSMKLELLQGVLATIQIIDSWKNEYLSALKNKEERGE